MIQDANARPLKDLRISVTDRCNFRCGYCMPYEEYDWVKRADLLTYEEMNRIARICVGLGVEKIRLTGGEPLVRKDLHQLVRLLSAIPGLKDFGLTTNGSCLSDQAAKLRAAGLKRINISLDTLNAVKFRGITQRGELAPVLDGIFAAKRAGLQSIKINAVIVRGINDDEILDLVQFGRENSLVLRFIEYMDVGNSNGWNMEKVVSKKEIMDVIHRRFPLKVVGRQGGRAPAVDYEFLDGGGRIGVIGSVTEPFCGTCDRARLTPDGKLVTCLFAPMGHDLKGLLRQGASDEHMADVIRSIWAGRKDRFSEERLDLLKSAKGYDPNATQKIEMIRLGG